MSARKNNPAEKTTDREIVITRVFDAPRELVWEAWTDPKHVAQWWGPQGFTTTIQKMDVRPGGVWKHVMHGPDGTDYPNSSVFKEVVKPERIVFSHGGGKRGGAGAHFVATWIFIAQGNKTRVTLRLLFKTAAERDKTEKEYGAIEGGNQTLARLAEHLAKMAERKNNAVEECTDRDFVITRIINAPRDLVFKAWTEPRHMARWWGPHDFTNPVCEMDIRPGGAHRIVMRSPEGVEYPIKGVYREVVAPERLVMTLDCTEHPKAWHDLVHPNRKKGEDNPAGEMLSTATFEDLEGKTKLTVRIRFNSVAIRDTMLKTGMNEGWTESLERLAAFVGNT